jgi:hypothetical protein
MIFCFCAFLCPRKSCFWHFPAFLELVSCFSHKRLKTSLIQQYKLIPYIYNKTFMYQR